MRTLILARRPSMPKPASAAGHALALFDVGVICETQWASATNAAEVLQLCEHVEMIQQVRQQHDLEITRPRSTSIAVPTDKRRWRHLAQERQRLTVRVLRNAREGLCETGVVNWTQAFMKQLVVKVVSLNIHPTVNDRGHVSI